MGDENHTAKPIPTDFVVPSPIPTRRTRTFSQSERAKASHIEKGIVQCYYREKEYGFIIPEGGDVKDHLFVHITDIEGEYIPKAGDKVNFKRCLIPPEMKTYQAVHVSIINLATDTTQDQWDQPSPTSSSSS